MLVFSKVAISFTLLAYFMLPIVSANDGGWSDTYRKQDNHGIYSFGYKIIDKHGAKQSREEHGDPWTKVGHYSLQDVDGRQRFVSYVADKEGFRAKIETNEPGTGNVDAANAIYNGPDAHGYSETHVPAVGHGHETSHEVAYDNHHDNHEDLHSHASNNDKNVQHVYHEQNKKPNYQDHYSNLVSEHNAY